ncbi:MAG TPA: vWA domain-containing protein [Kofleriaceae bacterium]|nr:vWA domain-containing protein [Kofleriaceae bacterium]
MPIRQRLVTYGFSTAAVATLALAALLQPWRPGGEPHPLIKPAPAPAAAVDVVFAVDTTGSMGGLLDGAKRTVWSIATHIRKTDPNAELRIGLVAYRDIGDAYVTRDFALTGDLDAVFAELASYRAEGGGDTPEDVDAALDDALHHMQWRSAAKKIVFLVGDAPPASRGDVARFDATAQQAGAAGIVINTIRCGFDGETEAAWRRIAQLGHGEFSTIEQTGGVQQIATPYDDEMARLSATIDSTTVIVGGDAERRAYGKAMEAAAAAPAPAKADRAAYYATPTPAAAATGGGRADHDLVGGVVSGKMSVDGVAAADLPEDLRPLSKAELKAEVGKRGAARKAAQEKLIQLTKQREAFLRDKAANDDGFDAKVKGTLDAQLKAKR